MEIRETVQQKIKKIASRFKGCNYVFMSWQQLNEKIDRLGEITEREEELLSIESERLADAISEKPVICYLLPPTGFFKVKQNGNSLTDNPLVEIAFLTKSEMDEDGEIDDVRIEEMKMLAQMFLREMNNSGLFEIIDREQITYTIVNEPAMDDAYVGIAVTIPLESKPFIMCLPTTDFGFE